MSHINLQNFTNVTQKFQLMRVPWTTENKLQDMNHGKLYVRCVPFGLSKLYINLVTLYHRKLHVNLVTHCWYTEKVMLLCFLPNFSNLISSTLNRTTNEEHSVYLLYVIIQWKINPHQFTRCGKWNLVCVTRIWFANWSLPVIGSWTWTQGWDSMECCNRLVAISRIIRL